MQLTRETREISSLKLIHLTPKFVKNVYNNHPSKLVVNNTSNTIFNNTILNCNVNILPVGFTIWIVAQFFRSKHFKIVLTAYVSTREKIIQTQNTSVTNMLIVRQL